MPYKKVLWFGYISDNRLDGWLVYELCTRSVYHTLFVAKLSGADVSV